MTPFRKAGCAPRDLSSPKLETLFEEIATALTKTSFATLYTTPQQTHKKKKKKAEVQHGRETVAMCATCLS